MSWKLERVQKGAVRNEQQKTNIRKREHYLVNHANTKRYQISSIPYMQRLLNKDQKLEEQPN